MQITVPVNYFRTESHRTKRIYKGRGGEWGGGNNKTLSILSTKKKKSLYLKWKTKEKHQQQKKKPKQKQKSVTEAFK